MKTPPAPGFLRIIDYVAVVPIAAFIGAWSFGLAALVCKKFDPAVPQWLVAIVIAGMILGFIMGLGRLIHTPLGLRVSERLVAFLLLSLFGSVFGGVYFWSAEKWVRGRDPAMTSLLAAGLGITIFGFGIATSMEVGHMLSVFGAALVGLIALRFVFPHSPMGMFRFGALHFLSFVLVMCVAAVENDQRKRERFTHAEFEPNQVPNHR